MQRCTELNVTNRSRAYPGRHRKEIQKDEDSFQYSVLREYVPNGMIVPFIYIFNLC